MARIGRVQRGPLQGSMREMYEGSGGGFFGREPELDALDAALDRAVRFQAPQTITLVGALGFGKSRLVAEWLRANEGTGLRVIRAAAGRGEPGAPPAPRALVAALLRDRFRLDGAPDTES